MPSTPAARKVLVPLRRKWKRYKGAQSSLDDEQPATTPVNPNTNTHPTESGAGTGAGTPYRRDEDPSSGSGSSNSCSSQDSNNSNSQDANNIIQALQDHHPQQHTNSATPIVQLACIEQYARVLSFLGAAYLLGAYLQHVPRIQTGWMLALVVWFSCVLKRRLWNDKNNPSTITIQQGLQPKTQKHSKSTTINHLLADSTAEPTRQPTTNESEHEHNRIVKSNGSSNNLQVPLQVNHYDEDDPLHHYDGDPLHMFDAMLRQRITPNQIYPFDTDYFTGSMLAMIRPPDNQMIDYFADKQRRFEFQVSFVCVKCVCVCM
jgi:hypothetical protein